MSYFDGLRAGLEFGRQWKNVEREISNLLHQVQRYKNSPYEEKIRQLLVRQKMLFVHLKKLDNSFTCEVLYKKLKKNKRECRKLAIKHYKCKCVLEKK